MKSISEINRNDAYYKFQENVEKLGETQKLVFDAIKENGSLTDQEIVEQTGLTLNCVNGRRNELVDMGLVIARDSKLCEMRDGGRTFRTTWALRDPSIEVEHKPTNLTANELNRVKKLIDRANMFQKVTIRGWLNG